MQINYFLQSIKSKHNVSQKTIELLLDELKEETVIKNDFIVKQGEHLYDIIFLLEGATISRFYRDGKEFVNNISFEGDIITIPLKDYKMSFATIRALENSIILRMNFSRFEDLMRKESEFALLGFQIIKHLLTLATKQYFDYTGLEAKDAYEKRIKENPDLINRISLKHLAAYLGITPSSLSRIRASVKKKRE